MFYSYEILERRGKFGTVWLAATKAGRLNKKDYTRVNVRRTCDDIIKVILLKGQPTKPHGGKPRYSLYLSAQLMYGVVRVHEKQYSYLAEEAGRLYAKFFKSKNLVPAETTHIDLHPRAKKSVGFSTMPDPLVSQYLDLDPSFGAIVRCDTMVLDPDPFFLPDVDTLLMSPPQATVSSSTVSSSDSPEQQMLAALGSPYTVSRPSDIRLQETITPEIDVHALIPGETDLMPLDMALDEMGAEGDIGRAALLSPHPSITDDEITLPVGSTPMEEGEDVWVIHPITGDLVLSTSLSPMTGILPPKRKKDEKEKRKGRKKPRVSAISDDEETARIRRAGDLTDIKLEDIEEEPPVDVPEPPGDISAPGVDVTTPPGRKKPRVSAISDDEETARIRRAGDLTDIKLEDIEEEPPVDVPEPPGDISAPGVDVTTPPGVGVSSPQQEDQPTEMDMVTPTSAAVKRRLHLLELSHLEEPEESPPKTRKGKKARRLVFADTTIQLTKEELTNNFKTSNKLCSPIQHAKIPKYPTVKELFEQPGRKGLHQSLIDLWKRNSKTMEEETPSTDEERAIWSVAHLHPRTSSSPAVAVSSTESELEDTVEKSRKPKETLMSTPETLRVSIGTDASTTAMIGTDDASTTAMEVTPASLSTSDISHQLLESREMSTSFPQELSSTSIRPGTSLQRIVEMEEVEIPAAEIALPEMVLPDLEIESPAVVPGMEDQIETAEISPPILPHSDLLRRISELTDEKDTITFKELVPTTTARNVAAKIFSACLDFTVTRTLRLSQEKAYGSIYIQRGPAFSRIRRNTYSDSQH